MKRTLLFLWVLFFDFCLSQTKITYPELVQRLTDLEYLSSPPLDGEVSGSFSSYDRSSKYDSNIKTYLNWHANKHIKENSNYKSPKTTRC